MSTENWCTAERILKNVIAVGGAVYLYGSNPLGAIAWILAINGAYQGYVWNRAKIALKQMKQQHDAYANPDYRIIEGTQLPRCVEKYFQLYASDIESEGFVKFLFYINKSFAGGPGELNYSAVYCDHTSQTFYTLSYIRLTRRIYEAFPVPVPAITGCVSNSRTIFTYFTGPGRLTTTDNEKVRNIPERADQFKQIFPETDSVSQLLAKHRDKVDELVHSGNYEIVPLRSSEAYFDMQNVFRRIASAYHRQVLDSIVEKNNLHSIDPRR